MPKPTIQQVKEKYEMDLINIEGVTGVGFHYENGQPVIWVYVERKTKLISDNIPDALDGYPVRIEATGELNALETDHRSSQECGPSGRVDASHDINSKEEFNILPA